MSEPHQLPTETKQEDEKVEVDPLLESGSFIDANQNDAVEETSGGKAEEETPNLEFSPDTVIAAQPISVVLPEDYTPEETPRSVRRRNAEEMSKRPSWLPEDWTIELKHRKSGATAGLIDCYYVEPEQKRKFRSKKEVFHFLETGSKLKRKANEADIQPSASPGSRKARKSSKKSESILQPTPLNSVPMDPHQQEI